MYCNNSTVLINKKMMINVHQFHVTLIFHIEFVLFLDLNTDLLTGNAATEQLKFT